MTDQEMVRALWDREQIVGLTRRYARGVDRRDWDQVRSAFTDGATVQGSLSGGPVDEYLATIRTAVEKYIRTMHVLSNHEVDLDGDRAKAQTYAVAFHWMVEPPGTFDSGNLVAGVRYIDDLVRMGDGWAIEHRQVSGEWSRRGL
jgi:hypothetical protein